MFCCYSCFSSILLLYAILLLVFAIAIAIILAIGFLPLFLLLLFAA